MDFARIWPKSEDTYPHHDGAGGGERMESDPLFRHEEAFLSYAPFVTLQEHGLLFRSHSGTIVRIADLNAENYR